MRRRIATRSPIPRTRSEAIMNEPPIAGLEYRNILVTGATGEVGWGVAHAAIHAGAHVILPTRTSAGLAALEAEFDGPRAHPVLADVGLEDGRQAALVVAERLGGLDHVIAPIGAWWQKGPSLEQPAAELDELLRTYVRIQFELVRAVAPALAASAGSYALVTGAAGEHVIRDAGLLVVAVRGQYALSEVLRAELQQADFRLNELRIATRIEREPRAGVVPSRKAGRDLLELATSGTRSAVLRYPPE